VLLAIALFWVWFFVGFSGHCPRCGVELPDDFAYPGTKVDGCPRCGWRDGDRP
jgi:hypothetical protein